MVRDKDLWELSSLQEVIKEATVVLASRELESAATQEEIETVREAIERKLGDLESELTSSQAEEVASKQGVCFLESTLTRVELAYLLIGNR